MFAKNVLICLTQYHRQLCILQFCDITKDVLQSSTGSLGLHISGVAAKFSDLIIGYSLLPDGNRVSEFLQKYVFCNVTKLQNAGLPMVRSQMD